MKILATDNSLLTINDRFVIDLKKVISINVDMYDSAVSEFTNDEFVYVITFYTKTNRIECPITFRECCEIYNIDVNIRLKDFFDIIEKEQNEWIEYLFKVFNLSHNSMEN